jgi:hypothetical protein
VVRGLESIAAEEELEDIPRETPERKYFFHAAGIGLVVRPLADPARFALGALRQSGFGEMGAGEEDLCAPDQMVQRGVPAEESWRERVAGTNEGLPVQFSGRAELIRNRESTGRSQDAADAERVRKIKAL